MSSESLKITISVLRFSKKFRKIRTEVESYLVILLIFISRCKLMLTVLKIIKRKQEPFIRLYIYIQHFRRDGEHLKSGISTVSLLHRWSAPAVVSVPVVRSPVQTDHLLICRLLGSLYPSGLLER